MSDPNLWVSREGNVVHPGAPLGGGGTGYFKSATPSGSGANLVPDVPEPFSPVGRNVILTDKQKQQIMDAYASDEVPMQNLPAKGPAITVTNDWANPDGQNDRTTVGIGELSSFVVSDVKGGSWKSGDGTGKTVDKLTFQWTARAAGTNTITFTAADNTTSSVTMTTVVPKRIAFKEPENAKKN